MYARLAESLFGRVTVWHNAKKNKKTSEKVSFKAVKIELTYRKFTRAYPRHRGTGTRCVAVCQKPEPHPYPLYPFRKYRGFTRTRVKPYKCSCHSDGVIKLLKSQQQHVWMPWNNVLSACRLEFCLYNDDYEVPFSCKKLNTPVTPICINFWPLAFLLSHKWSPNGCHLQQLKHTTQPYNNWSDTKA